MAKIFAVLDRRVGKRTLEMLHGKMTDQPTRLQEVFGTRLEAEPC